MTCSSDDQHSKARINDSMDVDKSDPTVDVETMDHEGKEINASVSNNTVQPFKLICCKTCNSTKECEEDVDNPGDYYCKCCWEEYAALNGKQQCDSGEQNNTNDNAEVNRTIDGKRGGDPQMQTSVQPLATQSPSEATSTQQQHTEGLSLTQPQTQALSQSQTQSSDSQSKKLPTNHADLYEDNPEECQMNGCAKKDGDPTVSDNNTSDGDSRQNKANLANKSQENEDVKNNSDSTSKGSSTSSAAAESREKEVAMSDESKSVEVLQNDEVGVVCNSESSEKNNNVVAPSGNDMSQDTVVHNNLTKHQVDEGVNSEERKDNAAENPSCDGIGSGSEHVAADETISDRTGTNSGAIDANDHDESEDDGNDDPLFMTQEENLTGLLTQAASEDDDNVNKQMDDVDAEKLENSADLQYDGAKINDEPERPPAIETAEQVTLSGLTGPSQHLSHSNKSGNNNTSSAKESAGTNEEMTVDQTETNEANQTEDTCGSLYGAQTQLLPVPHCPSKSNRTSFDEQEDMKVNNPTEISVTNFQPQTPEKTIDDSGQIKVTPRKGILSMISYPNDQAEKDNSISERTSNVNSSESNLHPENNGEDHDEKSTNTNDLSMEETEQSLDLLETSPNSRKQGGSPIVVETIEKADEAAWLSNHDGSKSPLLVLPAMASGPPTKNEANKPTEPAVEHDSLTADETEDESLFDKYTAHPLENDPIIEDTQTQDNQCQPKQSSYKRLSRGSAVTKNNSSLKSVSKSFSARTCNSSASKKQYGKRGSKPTPKVLHYAKADENVESEEEFVDGDESDDNGEQKTIVFEPSQTEYRALKQLEKVEEFTLSLPSSEEIRDLASRKELTKEIELYKLRTDVLEKEVNKMNKFLRQKDNVIAEMDEAIRGKDKIIKERGMLIRKQEDALAKLMNLCEGIKSPAKRTMDKDVGTGDDSDSGSIVLSALKRRAKPSYEKKHATKSSTYASKIVSTKKQATPCDISKGGLTNPAKSAQKHDTESSRPLSSEVWRELQSIGWKYKTGPEPYNKVYVPPDGSTHKGCSLGIHFFHGEQVMDAAMKRGHISSENGDLSNTVSHQSENEWSDANEEEDDGQLLDAPMDDSKLVGPSKLITVETGRLSIELVASFMKDESVSFKATLFNPIWQRLKVQGLDLNWKYEKCTGAVSLSRNWCYVPPSSDLGSKGYKGSDFFVKEEDVVLQVLQDAITLLDLSPLVTKYATSISPFMAILTRAVQDEMDYGDARTGKSPKTRSRRKTTALLNDAEEEDKAPKKRTTTPSKRSCTPRTAGKRKLPNSTSFSGGIMTTAKKKKKSSPSVSPAFHSSQTQRNEAVPPSFGRVSSSSSAGPLNSYEFFFSGEGVSDKNKNSIEARVKKLGGKVANISSDIGDKCSFKLFFLSEYSAWRRPKYLLAASLGVPMLHHEWLTKLEIKVDNGEKTKAMSSELYQKYRLPIGLDHSTGVFQLQRASNARDWRRPGSEEGEPVFEGMTIALAIEGKSEIEWKIALEALGATVIESQNSSLKGSGQLHTIDCCLLSSASLPPQVTSPPSNVSALIRLIPQDKPKLDLAWAHQSIIQRRRLPLSGDPRYEVTLGNKVGDPRNVYSIKSKTRRYEVGDLIQFSDRSKTTSYGRILGITWVKEGKCKIEVQLLENTGILQLADCPSSPKLFIEESSLDGSIVMLASKDMDKLGYVPTNASKSNIFRQVKQLNESQM